MLYLELKFPAIRQELINRGANPHIRTFYGKSEYEVWSLGSLSNVPKMESIFYPIKAFSSSLPGPFRYRTGVYPGKFGRVIGKGGEGIVIETRLKNKACAFKFVEVRDQKFKEKVRDTLEDTNARLREMIEMETISGTNILKLEGHHR